MTDQIKSLQGYVHDMLAVETELHEAFRRQKREKTDLRRFTARASDRRAHRGDHRPPSPVVAPRAEAALDRGVDVEKGGRRVLGAAAGLYDKLRSDATVSAHAPRRLRGADISTISYEMLHTTALAMKDGRADLAITHLKEYVPLIMAIGDALPEVLIDELATDGTVSADRGIATQAVRNTHEAWASATTTA